MVRHIVAWNFKDELNAVERRETAQKIKSELEALTACIDGIVELKVYVDMLPSGNRDIVLNSLFEDEDALAAYQAHPEHVRVGGFIGSVTCERVCVDYWEG